MTLKNTIHRFTLRMLNKDFALVASAAVKDGLKINPFIARAAIEKAKEVLKND